MSRLDVRLLFLDLETTGSDHTKDCIIEIGAVLVDGRSLDMLGEFHAIVRPTPLGMGRLMLNGTVRAMHEANGLLDALLNGYGDPADQVSSDLLGWLSTHRGADHRGRQIALAGSGVGHFDRRFLDGGPWARVLHGLTYWPIDVGVIRRAHDLWVGGLPDGYPSVADKTHRALEDARQHVDEARAFRALWAGAGR